MQIGWACITADPSKGNWQHVRDESVALSDVNFVSQLNRAQYVYRLSLRPTASATTQTAAFPFYLEVPALPASPSSSEEAEMCPPEIGAFALVEQTQCTAEEQHDDWSASQAAAMFGGTLAAALLLYSLLPYMRARNRKRSRSRSRTNSQTSKDRVSLCKDQQQELPTTPTTPNGASRRMWGSLDDDGIEPAGAHRDRLRGRKICQPEFNGRSTETGSELLLAKLPDFNDERGWRDFFDSQIYHNEPHEEQRAAAKAVANIKSRGDLLPQDSIAVARSKLRRMKTTTPTAAGARRSNRYRTTRDRIDHAAMEAALDEAQSFNEFWQM